MQNIRQNVHMRNIFDLDLHKGNAFDRLEEAILKQEAEYLNPESLSNYLFWLRIQL